MELKAARRALANLRLRRESAWALLALEHAPVALGLLGALLGERERRLPASILMERMRGALEALRMELRASGKELPQTAEYYIASWLRAGYLTRAFPPGAAEEEYELSAAALRSLRFVESLEDQRAVATESRLSLVIDQIRQLSEQTETDPQARLAALLRERERIDAEIEEVRAGRLEPLAADRALERIGEATALARELLADFRRVRDEFARINRELRERIVEHEGSRGEVLDQVFAGVDVVAESEAGRTFRSFWRLLTDPERSLAFEEALDRVLARDFARDLPSAERRFLLHLTHALLDNGKEVHEVLQQFARGLRQFVQSRAWREQRRLNALLREARREARLAREHVSPIREIGFTLFLTSAELHSVSRLRLHDPERERLAGGMDSGGEITISLESVAAMVHNSEIDFRSLREQVSALLAVKPQVSVAEALARYPARQGLGSVVGLLALASREGIGGRGTDRVCWEGCDGVRRCARIPRMYFVARNGAEDAHDGHG